MSLRRRHRGNDTTRPGFASNPEARASGFFTLRRLNMSCRVLAFAISTTLGLLCGTATQAAERGAAVAQPHPASQATGTGPKSPLPARRVDINSASKEELKTLPGIGDAEADRIIRARPYPSKAKLAVDQVIPGPLYDALQGRIVAAPPAPRTQVKTAARAASRP